MNLIKCVVIESDINEFKNIDELLKNIPFLNICIQAISIEEALNVNPNFILVNTKAIVQSEFIMLKNVIFTFISIIAITDNIKDIVVMDYLLILFINPLKLIT